MSLLGLAGAISFQALLHKNSLTLVAFSFWGGPASSPDQRMRITLPNQGRHPPPRSAQWPVGERTVSHWQSTDVHKVPDAIPDVKGSQVEGQMNDAGERS